MKQEYWWTSFGLILALTLWTRFYNVQEPAWVCWDETHFGKMGSWYINRTFFFDVHPPLGKMFIGGVGWLTGYNGTFPFEKPGDRYLDHSYLGMRIACTFLGACIVPFSFATVWEMTKSLQASILAGLFTIFDIGLITLNQYILLDPILLFFISASTYTTFKFRTYDSKAFSASWWFWLTLTGICIGGAISVKFVGLFIVLLVGLNTIEQLWNVLGDLEKPFSYTVKHFLARALCLIVLPVCLYISFFFVHLNVLYKSGNGDGHFSSSFQSALVGNVLHNASMPREVAYGAIITLKNHRTAGGYLHSHFHLYPEGIGAKQQQVTSYAHKDDNNRFLVKKWNDESSNEVDKNSDNSIDLLRHGDLVRLEHVITARNLHSHHEPAPMSKKMFQVTGYGENGTGDANDVWKVEIIGGNEGDAVKTVTSKIRLHHYFVKCVLTTTTKTLPKWAYEQQEVTCNPTLRDPNSMWNVEDNFFPKLPNVSFSNYAPGFVSRFLESHAVMFQGNAGLKPKEGEYTSRPWEWPINLRGQFFSGHNHRIYLLGNPIIWWGNIAFLGIFFILFAGLSLRIQRNYTLTNVQSKLIYSGSWLFLGWCLHYVPFWGMGRVLYFHHYFPALLFSSMLSAVILDFLIDKITEMLPSKISNTFYHCVMGSIISGLCYSFYLFSPLTYGMDETPGHMPNSSVHHLKWMNSWEF
ncbi:protein O-mannosyl-transferase 2 [Lepeophtheirus salmonis]|uniref:Protein O-mannosyl-transferase 2 n=1 Tax=Lepeophtheirus salmonis TaxID=72036 RepID=A0A0K2VHK4_LEPSM|nr:protein O-mannosyl-transferase 2-like [Lepeophtheirus salmonis]XP_040581657.1 protein O-mannosyl-transferase 2-like [Lepeophtheirus salmonis]